MSEMKKSWTAARGWLTKGPNKLDEVFRQEKVDKIELEAAMAQFDRYISTLDEAQRAYELELDENGLEAEIDSASQVKEQSLGVRLQAEKLLRTL